MSILTFLHMDRDDTNTRTFFKLSFLRASDAYDNVHSGDDDDFSALKI